MATKNKTKTKKEKKQEVAEHNLQAMPSAKSTGEFTRNEREQLNALSLELFGASSRWRKLVDHGFEEPVTEEVTEYVPNEQDPDKGENRQVKVLKLRDGMAHSVVKRHTPDSILQYMKELKHLNEQRKIQIEKMKEEQAKQKAADAKKAIQEATGSVD